MKAVLNLSMIFLLGQSTLSQGSVLKSGSTESSVSINAPEVVISYVVTLREHVSRVFSSPEWIRDLHVRITGDQAEAKSPNPGRRIVEQNQERLHVRRILCAIYSCSVLSFVSLGGQHV